MRIAVLPDAATAHATASQFAPDGAVLNGPALAPLAEAKAPAAKRRA
jgi:hypothetical protein